MAFIDYYKVMGIAKDCPQNEIKAAYRKRSKQFHPDLHPEDPKAKAKFQMLNEAYTVLSDPDKRAKYDKYGEQWKNAEAYEQAGFGGKGNPFGGFGGTEGWTSGGFDLGGSGGFSSFFENLFGGFSSRGKRAGRSYSQPASDDIQTTVAIDMYTALLGGEVILQTQSAKIKLKIKPCTQNGTKVRVKGKGLQRQDGTFGDLMVTFHVNLPTSLSERQKELLHEMRLS